VPQEASTPIITEAEVTAAQQGWCDALLKINAENKAHGQGKAKELAQQVLDQAYAYRQGIVLFKPTLAFGSQSFRLDTEGALAYFVGGNEKYPSDSGFALKGWEKCEIKNAGIHLSGDLGLTMGHVIFTDETGKVTTVDKTWGFKKDDQGVIRIVLHHSSLPYQPASD
jgi:hypothetical protein